MTELGSLLGRRLVVSAFLSIQSRRAHQTSENPLLLLCKRAREIFWVDPPIGTSTISQSHGSR